MITFISLFYDNVSITEYMWSRMMKDLFLNLSKSLQLFETYEVHNLRRRRLALCDELGRRPVLYIYYAYLLTHSMVQSPS